MEEILSRHRKEQRDLQSRVTQKKKSASKKTRKGVNDECATLEAELRERQAAEIAAINSDGEPPAPSDGIDNNADLLDAIAEATASQPSESLEKEISKVSISANTEQTVSGEQSKKPNRQKARLAKRAAEQEALAAQAAAEAVDLPDPKRRERNAMMAEFARRGFKEHEVNADGNCLYLSVADQMKQLEYAINLDASIEDTPKADYKRLRISAADYIKSHPDDFVPFLEEPLEDYVRKIRDTSEWGGHLELMALAKSHEININVLQGDGRVEKIEGDASGTKAEAWLAYYLHGFGLGEHYNSLRKV